MMHPVNRKKHQLAHRSLSQPVFQDLPHNNTQRIVQRQHIQTNHNDRPNMQHSPTTRHSTSSIKLSVENLPDDSYHDRKHYINEYGDIPEYDNVMYTNKAYRSSSPNNDSAIENTSPSSISSGSYIEQPPYRPNTEEILEVNGRYGSSVTGMSENDEHAPRGNSLRRHRYEDHNTSYGNPSTVQSYYGVDGVAVSQI